MIFILMENERSFRISFSKRLNYRQRLFDQKQMFVRRHQFNKNELKCNVSSMGKTK